jgi:parallel beta-helix repeat protein
MFVIIFLILIFHSNTLIYIDGEKKSYKTTNSLQFPNFKKTYQTHEPFNIQSDDNFTDYGFLGSGTKENPFRIENYYINTTEEKAISISKTEKYFLITDCFVIAEKYGIFIQEVANGTAQIHNNICVDCWDGIYVLDSMYSEIVNNTCKNNINEGIRITESRNSLISGNLCKNNFDGLIVYRSSQTIIENNTCEGNLGYGIIIWDTHTDYIRFNICNNNNYGLSGWLFYGIIADNICSNNTMGGIELSGSSYSTAINNTCKNNGFGIYNIESFSTLITNNTCDANDYGIFLTMGSWYNTIVNNTCVDNLMDGIYLERSRYLVIKNNSVLNNARHGIYLERTINCTIKYNLFKSNQDYGVYLERRTNYTRVIFNFFINNNPLGSSQGYDDGLENKWYLTESKAGNYWSDWDKGKYLIDGSAESVDKYPLDENLDRVSYLPFLLISLFLILISIPIQRRKTLNVV